jgi:hypothetical protein
MGVDDEEEDSVGGAVEAVEGEAVEEDSVGMGVDDEEEDSVGGAVEAVEEEAVEDDSLGIVGSVCNVMVADDDSSLGIVGSVSKVIVVLVDILVVEDDSMEASDVI